MTVNLPESYLSLSSLGKSDEIVISKSRFIGYAKTAIAEKEAVDFIDWVKSEHPMASCICYGYVCGYGNEVQKYHDGHEPVGGKPILSAIKLKNLIGVTCVVARYFGGVKLGVGGLARAFGGAAAEAIEKGVPAIYELGRHIEITYDYLYDGKISYLIDNSPLTQGKKEYSDKITADMEMKNKYYDEFISKLNAITSNSHSLSLIEEKYIC